MKKVLIIGAGAIGLHCAYYLKSIGYEVEVIEERGEGDHSACSYGNCGFAVPSHFITMASPSILKSGLKMILNPNGPVAFNLLQNIQRVGWFVKFTSASINKNKVRKAIPLLYKLNVESNLLYQQINKEHDWFNEYQSKGLVMVASSEKSMEEEIEVSHIAEKLGIKTQVFDNTQLNNFEPNVRFNAYGGVLYHSDAHVNPGKHMNAISNWLKKSGVVFQYGKEVSYINYKKGKINAVYCGKEKFTADEYVLAAGVGSYGLAKKINLNLPVIAGKGYSMDFNKGQLPLETPVILTDEKVALSPFESMVRLGSGMEFNGALGKVKYKRIQSVLNATSKVIPAFNYPNVRGLSVWEGQRPLSADGLPFIGRSNKYNNLTIASGHAMMGMSLAPVTGKMVAQIIKGETPVVLSPLLSPNRY